MNARTETVAAEEYALEISRVFDAPPSLVFKAFTKPEHMVRWWGTKNFSTTVEKLEFREGGSYRFTIHGPNDRHHGMSGDLPRDSRAEEDHLHLRVGRRDG